MAKHKIQTIRLEAICIGCDNFHHDSENCLIEENIFSTKECEYYESGFREEDISYVYSKMVGVVDTGIVKGCNCEDYPCCGH